MPKCQNFIEDLIEREIRLSILTEIWEKPGKRKHKFNIEKMLHMHGYKYISTPRPPSKRGGGAAIVASIEKFSLEKLDVLIPHNLEVCWGLLRPKTDKQTGIREIIVASFYSPPKSKKKAKLLDHLLSTIHILLTKFPNAGVIIGADKNDLNISSLLLGIPKVKQIVTKNTYKDKILDIIITNLHQYYMEPEIVPPVLPDNPNYGAPSDHKVPVATPLSRHDQNSVRHYREVQFRPTPQEGVDSFGDWLNSEDWTCLDVGNPTEQVKTMESKFKKKMDKIFPLKTLKICSDDKPWINCDLKSLSRRKRREYVKHGRSLKYQKLQEKFDKKYREAAERYLTNNVNELKFTNPGKAYKLLRRMGNPPGGVEDEGSFSLQNHAAENMSPEESIEKIADFFSLISQEYEALNINLLPERVKVKLRSDSIDQVLAPQLSEQVVWEEIKKSKKTNSMVPGDVPKSVLQQYSKELAVPITKIFKQMVATKQWPAMWRTEYGVPLQKVTNPENENQLRIISLTAQFSKTFENLVIKWLYSYIGNKLDPQQFGGRRGSSITHYMIELLNFILYNQDLPNPNAVMVLMADYSKAFNRQDHNTLITILSDMGCPRWLLEIIISFLSDRELIVRHKGRHSSRKHLPGGTPQGTRLGMFLFLVLINYAGIPMDQLSLDIGDELTNRKRNTLKPTHMKYIDDLSLATAINLKENLVKDLGLPRPLSYHERTSHRLPE